MIIVREEEKKYGTKKQIEGNYNKNSRCVIIDDVITSGKSIQNVIDILYDKNEFSKKLTEAKKPTLIIGQALLNREDSIQIYSLLETFIEKFNMVNDEWNGFNVLQLSASRAGSLEVGCYQKNKNLDDIFDDARNEKVKLLISFGADEIDYENFHMICEECGESTDVVNTTTTNDTDRNCCLCPYGSNEGLMIPVEGVKDLGLGHQVWAHVYCVVNNQGISTSEENFRRVFVHSPL